MKAVEIPRENCVSSFCHCFWLIQKDLLYFSLIVQLLKKAEKLLSSVFLIAKKMKSTLLISTLCPLIFSRREEQIVLSVVGLRPYFYSLAVFRASWSFSLSNTSDCSVATDCAASLVWHQCYFKMIECI